MSQHARAELLALAKSSGVFPLLSNNSDARRTESYPIPVVSQAPSNHNFAEPNSFENSFANSSGALSTPSDKYDEDAENIDPNSPQNQQNQHPFAVYPRITNILRDSEAYPIASYRPLALRSQYEGAQAYDADESIAAPVPLSYSARSKEVLSSMISPPQPPGFPQPASRISHQREPAPSSQFDPFNPQTNYILPATNFSSNAGLHNNYSYSRETAPAQYTISYSYTAPRTYIRPVSPTTLIALTEPYLMAWVHDYPPLRPLPSPSPSYTNWQWP
ncbi:hypothetical protein DFH08DRAFT_1078966 [Mycena albidolilacea]|uniref:Uncharacterized protein n=1 Tax=Mycena albidolilacea TaxID=1033008 RepID=A0AAD7A703_9AGAR|nr:hypothetical protein DFH08DRAFT_1078966 [Mycena albidolilacea]